MKLKVIKKIETVETVERIETKQFKFISTDGEDIIYNVVAPDDKDEVFIYWTSKIQEGKLLHMWYSKEYIESNIDCGVWVVVEVLDDK